jgi:hypothetical protein
MENINIDELFDELKSTKVDVITEISKESELGDLYDVAVSYYGEEHVEHISTKRIIIHFPEITIKSNGADKASHTIYDLYVKLDFIDGNIKGIRTSFSKKELINFPTLEYIHSHLPGSNISINAPLDFNNSFCLGPSELLNAFSYIKSEYNNGTRIDENLYYYLFSNLDSYLIVENHKDGGSPYRRISMINTYTTRSEYISSGNSVLQDTVDYFIQNSMYEINGNTIEFQDSYDNWKIFLAEYGTKDIAADLGEYDMAQGCGINKRSGLGMIIMNPDWQKQCFIFKGKPVEFKIIDNINQNKEEIHEQYPKKVFIDEIKRRFNDRTRVIAETSIKNYTKNIQDTCSYATRLVWKVMDATPTQ